VVGHFRRGILALIAVIMFLVFGVVLIVALFLILHFGTELAADKGKYDD